MGNDIAMDLHELRLTFMNIPNPYEHRILFSTTNSTNSTNYNDIAAAISIFA